MSRSAPAFVCLTSGIPARSRGSGWRAVRTEHQPDIAVGPGLILAWAGTVRHYPGRGERTDTQAKNPDGCMEPEPTVLDSLRRAVEAMPDDVPLRLHLATLLLRGGERDEAVRQLGAVLQRDPGNAT